MIAPARPARRRPTARAWTAFIGMLPAIARHASLAFRSRKGDERDDLIQETIANAARAFARLVELGKPELAYPSVLARFAVRQVLDGRKVGSKLNVRDVLSKYAQSRKGFHVDRLDCLDEETGQWQEIVVEDRHAGPAEVVECRIDFGDWMASLPRPQRQIADTLAMGETTGATAHKFGLSAGRVSQLRRELMESWKVFVGETVP